MEEQQKMNNDDEELFNKYFSKIKNKAKETLAKKHSMAELGSGCYKYAMKSYVTKQSEDIENMAILGLLASFLKRKNSSI